MKEYGFQFDNTYLTLPEDFFAKLNPVPVATPKMVMLNEELAATMGLALSEVSDADQAALFSGNYVPEGSEPFAQAYAGHQFGGFTMLGDGRAHMLGEHLTPDGQRFDIQFKGAGRTPYSRRGDGRAALGPMLREYIISEAMHALGIPTTRSLAVAITGEQVLREERLPGAILTRVAKSHLRVGTFQFAAAHRGQPLVEALLDYTIARHDPEAQNADNKALAFLTAVMERQVDLIVHWMRVGFIHGVMNTDNMTISGEAIDYGPCAFMDAFDPATVFSSIDHQGRYAFANQPVIAQWNIARLAETLLPIIDADQDKAISLAKDMISQFTVLYKKKWLSMMRAKLGLFGAQPEDEKLAIDLLSWMQTNHADYTNTFRDLTQGERPSSGAYRDKAFGDWYTRWQQRLAQNSKPMKSSLCLMRKSNPAVIPRNHKVEEALDAANKGGFGPFHDLLKAVQDPYTDRDDLEPYRSPPSPGERVYQTFCGT